MIEQEIPWDRQPPGLEPLASWLPIPQILWFPPLWRDIVGGLAPTVTGTVARAVGRGGVGASFQSGGILDFGDRFNGASFTNLLVFELPSLAATALSQSEYDNGASESLSSQYIDATAAGDIRLVRDGAAVLVETTAGGLIAAKREHWVIVSWDQAAGSGFIAIDGHIRAVATPGTQAWVTNGRYVLGRRRPVDLSATSDHIQYVHARWGRAFSQAEARRLTGGRYAELFAPRVEEVFEPPGGGATPKTATSSLSAAIQAARSATASIAAAVQTPQTASASVAAAVQASANVTASATAAVQQSRTATSSVTAAVQAARSAEASIAAAVQRGQTASADLAAAVQASRTATASASAAVQAPQSATASLAAYVQAGSTISASLSAAVQAARTAQASVAAAVQAPHTAQASLAAAVAQAQTVSASLAAGVQEARTASASLSAQVQAGTTVVALLTAAIREARAASASIAAAVAVARTASASLSTAIAVQRSLTALFQGAVQARRTATASLAAYISTPGSHTISPRLYLVDPQDRSYLIDPEDRTYIVPASSRSTTA